ncbi:MAG: NAD-dependent epimerase/dehydratase family protein [Chloroflexi bacterium]|nr:NAD-dependent epimerase/dehydratase family protein [Chloroflexota bacterium]
MVDLLLERDWRVTVLDSLATGRLENLRQHRSEPRLDVLEMDVCALEPSSSILNDVTYVFHFAGMGDIVPSIERPLAYMHANVDGTLAVVEAARHSRISKLVYAASSSCYGPDPPVPTAEDAPIRPAYPYALSKYLGESVVLHWGQLYHLPVNSIRIFNAYGPRVRTTGAYGAVFGVFLAQRLHNRPLTVVGDGTQTRDFVHVRDVARAFWLAAESTHSGHVYNVGGGQPRAVNELARLIGGDITYIPKRPGEPDCTWADIRKVKGDLHWEPTVNFERGVAEMVQDIQAWADAPVWDAASIATATRTWFEYLAP